MNKTLALIAALGLVVAAPAFAADPATPATGDTAATAAASSDATSVDKKDTKKAEAATEETTKGKHRNKKLVKKDATKMDSEAPTAGPASDTTPATPSTQQ